MMGRTSPRLPQQREPGVAERHGGNPRSHHQAPSSASTTKPYLSMTYDPPCRLVIPLPTAVATVPSGGIAFSPSSQPPPPPIQGPAAGTSSLVQKPQHTTVGGTGPSGSGSSSGPKVAFAVNTPFPPQPSTATTATASRKGMASPAATAGATLLGVGGAVAVPPPPSEYSIAPTGVVLEHQYQKAPTVDTRIAWFATNLPREVSARSSRKAQLERTAATKAAAAATTTTTTQSTPLPAALQAGLNNQLPLSGALHHKLTSRDLQEGKFRGLGWVEPPVFGAPCPPSASSRKLQEGPLISEGILESNSQMSATTLRLMGSRSHHTALDNSGRSDGAPPDRRTTAQPASSAHASAAANALLKNQLLGGGTEDDAFAKSKQQAGGWLAASKGMGKHVAGGGRLRAGTVPTEVMILIFRFCSPTFLDRSVVLVSRLWHYIVVSSTLLQRQRFTFEMPPFHGLVSKHEEGKAGAPVSTGRGAVLPTAAALLTPGSSSLNSGHEPLLTGGKRQPGVLAMTTSFPVPGILYYLATRKQNSAALRASSATSNDARTGNPAYGLEPVVRNFCVSTLAEAGPYLRGSVPPPSPPASLPSSVLTSNMNHHRQKAWKAKGAAAAAAGVSSSSSSSAALSDPRDFTSFGPSSFTTAAVPFAWAGFELQQGMKVIPTAYCFCSSLLIQQGSNVGALPNSWELQCCAVPSTRITEGGAVSATEWATAQWHLLHVVPSLHEAVADGRVAVVSLPSGARQVFCTLPELRSTATKALMGQLRPHDAKDYGAMCRFRMVQTGRNEQWGESMAVSGFELFGWLQKTHQR